MSNTRQPTAPQLATPAPRIDALDLLRGIAILGIFLMNTWTMSVPQDAYTNPASYNPHWVIGHGFPTGTDFPAGQQTYADSEPLTGVNRATYTLIHLFADMKFITTFSILFGAGIVLQAQRSQKKGRNPWSTHYLRMSVLLIFGLCHTFGFWYGDILTDYALAGLILAPARLLPPSLLMLIGIVMIALVTAIDQARVNDRDIRDQPLTGWISTTLDKFDSFDRHIRSEFSNGKYYDSENDKELDIYRGGWWGQIIGHRAATSIIGHTTEFLTWTFPRCGGCLLLGMALQKRRFFHAVWPREAYATIAAIAVPLGWMISFLGTRFNDAINWSENWYSFFSLWHLGVEFNYWGSLLTAFGYISIGVLLAIWAANPAHSLLRLALIPVRAVGRMALSCYLAETLLGTTIFYGHGLGYFGYLTRAQLLPIVLGTWIAILAFATLWLTFFRQGPFEWFWHSLVYWDWQNPRHGAAGPDASLSPSVAGSAGES